MNPAHRCRLRVLRFHLPVESSNSVEADLACLPFFRNSLLTKSSFQSKSKQIRKQKSPRFSLLSVLSDSIPTLLFFIFF
ncbi:hypothetical protein RJT34_17767 [Clitoria ternatea]|uniref:Uncharacterized protein n=1 Tax=Clitoria ternatea TaxID=43366 RepID=A0AAN9J9J5_CLITE